eukprot:g13821.t1
MLGLASKGGCVDECGLACAKAFEWRVMGLYQDLRASIGRGGDGRNGIECGRGGIVYSHRSGFVRQQESMGRVMILANIRFAARRFAERRRRRSTMNVLIGILAAVRVIDNEVAERSMRSMGTLAGIAGTSLKEHSERRKLAEQDEESRRRGLSKGFGGEFTKISSAIVEAKVVETSTDAAEGAVVLSATTAPSWPTWSQGSLSTG